MTNFHLKVSRKVSIDLFKRRQIVKHGKGKVPKGNPMLFAKHTFKSIEHFIDKDINVVYDSTYNLTEYREYLNNFYKLVGEKRIGSTISKRQLAPNELLYAEIHLKNVDDKHMQKIIKQLLFLHGAKVPLNKIEFRAMVDDRNLKRKELFERNESKTKRKFEYENFIEFKGEFWASQDIPDLWDKGKPIFYTEVIKIVGIDQSGNLILDKGLYKRMELVLFGNVLKGL